MKWFLDIAYLAIGASYKWLLGVVVIVGALVGILFGVGVLGGGDSDLPGLAVAPTRGPLPTPVLSPTPTPVTIPAPTTGPLIGATAEPGPTEVPAIMLPKAIKVPINLEGASNLGSLEFVLVYQPSVLELTGVEWGALAGDALMESSATVPGLIWTGMIDANGISGDGPAALISFAVVGDSGSDTQLALENVVAHDATTLLDVITQVSPGSFVVKDGSLSAPTLGFLP